MPMCICGNFISQYSYNMKPKFSIDLCHQCLASSNSPSIWNKEYVCEYVSDDTNLFNKEQNND
jgi:hypothetical protein